MTLYIVYLTTKRQHQCFFNIYKMTSHVCSALIQLPYTSSHHPSVFNSIPLCFFMSSNCLNSLYHISLNFKLNTFVWSKLKHVHIQLSNYIVPSMHELILNFIIAKQANHEQPIHHVCRSQAKTKSNHVWAQFDSNPILVITIFQN